MPPTYSLLLCIPSEVPALTILPGELSAVRLGELSGKFRITSWLQFDNLKECSNGLPVQLKTRLSDVVGYIPLSSMWRNVWGCVSLEILDNPACPCFPASIRLYRASWRWYAKAPRVTTPGNKFVQGDQSWEEFITECCAICDMRNISMSHHSTCLRSLASTWLWGEKNCERFMLEWWWRRVWRRRWRQKNHQPFSSRGKTRYECQSFSPRLLIYLRTTIAFG